MIGDNAYLFGKLLDNGDVACAMRAGHSVCAPTPDGLVMGIKK